MIAGTASGRWGVERHPARYPLVGEAALPNWRGETPSDVKAIVTDAGVAEDRNDSIPTFKVRAIRLNCWKQVGRNGDKDRSSILRRGRDVLPFPHHAALRLSVGRGYPRMSDWLRGEVAEADSASQAALGGSQWFIAA